jgi:hypothetical protein
MYSDLILLQYISSDWRTCRPRLCDWHTCYAPLLLLAAVENIILALAVGDPKLGLVLHTPGSHTETDRHEQGKVAVVSGFCAASKNCMSLGGGGGVDG